MTDDLLPSSDSAATNVAAYSVSELAGALKRTLETTYDHVRLRGEISKVTRHASGHVYLTIKDDKAAIDGVIWKGNVSRLQAQPEHGLEVIVTGKITTFPASSKYQIVIEAMEVAGVGALLAQLDRLKKKLHAEGLFDPTRKKPLPYAPKIIGVITSPTGAVIRAFSHLAGAKVGEGALIGPYARLRPGAEIGKDAHIGNFVEVKNVTVGEGAKANHLSYLGDGTVGAGSNIGAGTIFCNYDGYFKAKTTIGANAFIGSNTSLVAPVTIGDGAMTGSGSVITRDVAPGALALERVSQIEKGGWATAFREHDQKKAVGEAAIAYVKDGMKLGLGTGSTA
eukprot:gene28436-36678_t